MTARTSWLSLVGGLLAAATSAQNPCVNSGSTLAAASLVPSPLSLGCIGAPNWPMWQQFTPPHRMATPHVGFRPGRGEAVPVIVVQYRCTGLLLAPVIASGYINMGYVIDMPEHACN